MSLSPPVATDYSMAVILCNSSFLLILEDVLCRISYPVVNYLDDRFSGWGREC